MNELDIFDFDTNDFDLDLMDDDKIRTRIHKPKLMKPIKDSLVKYRDAKKLAKDIDLSKTPRVDCLVSGSFIFWDFIEAYLVENNIQAVKMTISTLSMSQNNIDSLATLLIKDYIKGLDLIVSDYFFSHERNKLIKYAYEQLDLDNKFQLAVSRTHTKICFFETLGGKKIVIHGSANLRTSGNIEQFTIEINKSLYDFYNEFHKPIIEKYQTINKTLSNNEVEKIFNN